MTSDRARERSARATLRFVAMRAMVAAAIAAGGGEDATALEIHGAGATFPAPVYAKWADAYRSETGIVVRYDAVGSGRGLELIHDRRVDFGASDVPDSAGELRRFDLVEFPAVIGGVVPVVNLSGVAPGDLKLSGDVLAAIFGGRIARWNDPAIAALNPALHLPSSRITVVHREDASGTTFLWTSYLAAEDAQWRRDVGRGTRVDWPTGVAGTGNEGVASYVKRTRASIGYVEYAYAKAHRLGDVSLRDASGLFIRADPDRFAEAIAFAASGSAPGEPVRTGRGWPVTGATYILVPRAGADAERRRDVLAFFGWALRHGQALARSLDYVPIPDAAAERIIARLNAADR
jgi:phosphate transport system substrate-binding protein